MAVTLNEIDERFGGFGAVDIVTRTPWDGFKVNTLVPVTFTLTIELMPFGRNNDKHPELNTPAAIRNSMYDMAEQIINLVEKYYQISDAPKIEINGNLYWDEWPTSQSIFTVGRVTVEFMEKGTL